MSSENVSATRGREIAAGLPGYAWVARIVGAVEQRTGMPTRWNGKIFEELDPAYAGSADRDDGSLTLGKDDVMTPAERAYTRRELTAEAVQMAVDAAATVCHEARHLSSPLAGTGGAAAHPLADAPGVALDEGLVERLSAGHGPRRRHRSAAGRAGAAIARLRCGAAVEPARGPGNRPPPVRPDAGR